MGIAMCDVENVIEEWNVLVGWIFSIDYQFPNLEANVERERERC